ncbi:MAG: hypothetical protein JWP45_651 [Mucilaginibacter sp.]|nr:hypothetical protein [Mucilaginibacter sp.]
MIAAILIRAKVRTKVLFFLLSVSGFGVSDFWGWKKGLSKFMLMLINKLFGFPKE